MDRVLQRLAVAFVLALTGAACGGGGDGEDGGGNRGDASARLACGHFSNVRQDVIDGILTGSELREKLQEVHDSARVSEVPGIAEGARTMLAAVTSDDTEAFGEGVMQFDEACSGVDLS